MKNNSSFNVALGGICGALAVMAMLVTAIVPVLDFAMPAIAGGLMAIIVIEINKRWAMVTYVAVAFVSMLIVPSKEVGLLFTMFLGYYPIVKSLFEKAKAGFVQWGLKIGLFNVAVVLYYFATIKLISSAELLSEADEIGKYGLWILLVFANVVFVIYDIALTRVISMYINWFRKKYLRR